MNLISGLQPLRFLLALAGILLLTSSPPAQADATAGTLDRIRRDGVLRLGYGTTPPFSYRDADGNVTGYSVEICKLVAEDLKRQLGLDALDIVYVPRTPIDRVQLLNEGEYDLECEASTNTEERRRSAAFALSHFFTATRFVSLAKNGLHRIDDLRGHSIAAALGTVNIAQIGRINRERRLQLSLIPVESLQQAFDMVTTGRASAFVMDDILLEAMIRETGQPALYTVSDDTVSAMLPYGFMMRKDDTPFHAAVNAALGRIYATPQIDQLYDRWFRNTLPGLAFGLDIPMSRELTDYFAMFR
ncbi:amino acid ABC transporter substrate-binding protein [Rhizobiaceae bacterium BDR2-2]|uniref:Amino acid ABC transporter substrate-binding protein n=1 Tax=Ectorhizobium quercum TaxID=2965071 RepID=A0AAE3MYS4_9HYPH|nr:amino acid ABC transporter substrate-binding protein [Ectorhizobium quercum]MCX8996956.1 amino acid ABC transporter substrate-binding protein [Ectorhizobium quercum]